MLKECSRCKETKNLDLFHNEPRNSDGKYSQCKECRLEAKRLYRKKNPNVGRKEYLKRKERVGSFREENLKARYGITLEEYTKRYEEVKGKCGICFKSYDTLHIDHCHITGQIRGLLCRSCNTGVGKLGDSIEGLEKAINYLRKSYGKT